MPFLTQRLLPIKLLEDRILMEHKLF